MNDDDNTKEPNQDMAQMSSMFGRGKNDSAHTKHQPTRAERKMRQKMQKNSRRANR